MTPEEFANYILDHGPLTREEHSWLTEGQAEDYLAEATKLAEEISSAVRKALSG